MAGLGRVSRKEESLRNLLNKEKAVIMLTNTGQTYSYRPTGVTVGVMNGPNLLIEFGAAIDVLNHAGIYQPVCREGWWYCIQ